MPDFKIRRARCIFLVAFLMFFTGGAMAVHMRIDPPENKPDANTIQSIADACNSRESSEWQAIADGILSDAGYYEHRLMFSGDTLIIYPGRKFGIGAVFLKIIDFNGEMDSAAYSR